MLYHTLRTRKEMIMNVRQNVARYVVLSAVIVMIGSTLDVQAAQAQQLRSATTPDTRYLVHVRGVT